MSLHGSFYVHLHHDPAFVDKKDLGRARRPAASVAVSLNVSAAAAFSKKTRQSTSPSRAGGLRLTIPSDVVLPAFLGSRFDSADFVVSISDRMSAEAALVNCVALLTEHFTNNGVPHYRGER